MKPIFKPFCLALCCLLLFAALFGCAQSKAPDMPNETAAVTEPAQTAVPAAADEPAQAETAITVTDMAGRVVTLDRPAERIVALAAADCEILFALEAGGTLVGRGEYCDFPNEVASLPSVQSGYETNLEEILALSPDVVILPIMSQKEEHVTALENAGIPVVVTNAQDVEGVYAAVRLLGELTGKRENAENIVTYMQSSFRQIADACVPAEPKKTVYFEVSPLAYGLWTAGSGTFMNELAALLGLENAFADVEGWSAISEEQVLARDPDYIVTIAMYYGEGQTPVDEILARAGWENLKAVKNGAVFNADSNEISRPGPRLVDAAYALRDFVQSCAG